MAKQDKSADHEEAAKWLGMATKFSGPTMVIYVLVISFAMLLVINLIQIWSRRRIGHV